MYLKVETADAANKLSELLKDGDWMVLYYAEWCGHCNAMKPEWEKVVEKLKETGKINVADVKSDVIDELLHKPKIEGFPTIKMYNKGQEVAKFEDERSAEKIEKFAMSNSTSTKTPSKSEILHTTINEPKINLEELLSTSIPTPISTLEPVAEPKSAEVPIQLGPAPIVLDNNMNEVKKLSISQLKDEILKSHRKSKSASRKENTNELVNIPKSSKKVITNISNLDMLLQSPTPSIKTSKKPKNIKPKSKSKIHTQSHPNNRKSNKTVGTLSPEPALPHTTLEQQSPSNLSCSDIIKAKMCKNNPKCFYDYVEFKCKDKSEKPAPKPKLNNFGKDKTTKRSKRIIVSGLAQNQQITQQQNKRQSGRQNHLQQNNKKNVTKELLQELRKSFKKIGNEAKKDYNLLAKASDRI